MASAGTKDEAKKKDEEIKALAEAVQPTRDAFEKHELRTLPVKSLQASPTNPRKRFDEAGLEELAASIKVQGLVQPIVARPLNGKAKPGGPTHEIVAGERRWRAASKAGVTFVPVIERKLSDADVAEIQLTENAQREDITPLEEARAYEQAMKVAKYTAEALASKVGKSVRHVWARLALLKLPKDVAEAFDKGWIGADHAAIIARLPEEDRERALEVAGADPSFELDAGADTDEDIRVPVPVRVFREWVEREVWRKLDAAPWKKDAPHNLKDLGTRQCSTCKYNTSVNPALGGRAGCCTEPECFEAKMKHHIAEVAPTVPLKIDQNAYRSKGGSKTAAPVLGTQDYEKAKKPGKDTQPALVTNGAERGQVIHVKLTKQGQQALKQAGQPAKKPTPDRSEESRKQQQAREDREEKVREHLFGRLLPKIAWPLPRKAVELLVAELPMWGTTQVIEICRQAGLTEFGKHGPFDGPKGLAKVAKLSNDVVARYLTAHALAESIGGYGKMSPAFAALLKLYGINETKARAELEAAEKKVAAEGKTKADAVAKAEAKKEKGTKKLPKKPAKKTAAAKPRKKQTARTKPQKSKAKKKR